MKNFYTEPEMEIERFVIEDIILTSPDPDNNDGEEGGIPGL